MARLVLRRPSKGVEIQLYKRGIVLGADGCILHDDVWAYCIPLGEFIAIDYFHGHHNGEPICQDAHGGYWFATDLLGLGSMGFVVRRMRHLQRRIRACIHVRRARRAGEAMINLGLLLARKWRALEMRACRQA